MQQLHDNVREAKAEAREVLDRLVGKNGMRARDITYAMGYVDDMLDDATYTVETALDREIEA